MTIDALWWISAACLSVTIVLCFVALVSVKRHDMNPLMYVGLLGIMWGSIPRVRLLVLTQSFNGQDMPPLAQIAVHVGLFCFLAGYSWRFWWSHKHDRRNAGRLEPLHWFGSHKK